MIHNAENSIPTTTARQCNPRAILYTATAILLAIIALSATWLSPAQNPGDLLDQPSPSPAATVPGRYQLQTAVIDTEPTIFRIDTATGRTWQLIGVPAVIQGTRGHVNGWQPVSENPWRTAEAMTQPSKTASPPK